MTLLMFTMTERHYTLLFRLPLYFFPTFLLLTRLVIQIRADSSTGMCGVPLSKAVREHLAFMAGAAKGNKMGVGEEGRGASK